MSDTKGFDREMQRALLADAQKLRDMGVDEPDPIFFSTPEDELPAAVEDGGTNG